jgi:ATP-dependent helicase Lhr and Lhr-like helicase
LFSAAYPGLKLSGHFEHPAKLPIATAPVPSEEERGATPKVEQVPEVVARDAAIEEIVRRALVTSGPIVEVDLAQRLRLPVDGVTKALISLESKGSIFRGHFTADRSDKSAPPFDETADNPIFPRDQGEVTRGLPSCASNADGSRAPSNEIQWCDRFVLERIHRQTLNLLRSSVEPCNDAEFVAFRLKWNGIAETSSRTGIDGVRRVLEQMNGLAFTPELWERAILPARVADYRAEHLDLLCMSGEVAWVAAPFQDEFEPQRDFPRAVAFLPRRGRSYWPAGEAPADTNAQKVVEVLTRFGAQYLDQVAERADLSERDALAGLWRLAAAGLVSNDSFAPLRLMAVEPDAARLISNRHSRPIDRKATRRDAALRARLQSSLSGRWSIVQPLAASKIAETHDAHGSDDAREVALILLRRHGILAREMMALEQIEIPWQQILFALRRLEYAGMIRRGWFVRAMSGEQYGLPEALEMLRGERQAGEQGFPAVMSAADPANPFGVLLPGCGVAREPDNVLVVQGGRVLAGLAGRAITCSLASDEASFVAQITQFMRLRPRLVLETINGEPSLESAHVSTLAAMGFHSDGRALVYDGLPGPTPRRAIASHAGP